MLNILYMMRFAERRMKMNDIIKYDPDGGYWDPETDTWVKYDDMDTI